MCFCQRIAKIKRKKKEGVFSIHPRADWILLRPFQLSKYSYRLTLLSILCTLYLLLFVMHAVSFSIFHINPIFPPFSLTTNVPYWHFFFLFSIYRMSSTAYLHQRRLCPFCPYSVFYPVHVMKMSWCIFFCVHFAHQRRLYYFRPCSVSFNYAFREVVNIYVSFFLTRLLSFLSLLSLLSLHSTVLS